MENENVTPQMQQTNPVEEKKAERVDELDIMGGALVKLVMKGFNRMKEIFVPRKVE